MAVQHEDNLKSVSLSPTTTSLLRPMADLLDTELKDFVEAKIQSAKAKKEAENLKSHSKNKNCIKMIGAEGVAWPPRVKLSRELAPAGC